MRRRVRQHEADSDLEGVPGWSIECKRYRQRDPAATWPADGAQAVAQANRASALPVLFYRLDRAEWRAAWPLAIVLIEQRADYWQAFEWAADTSVQAWAAVARDVAAATAESAKVETVSAMKQELVGLGHRGQIATHTFTHMWPSTGPTKRGRHDDK